MAVSVVHARGLCLASSLGNKVAEKTIESSTKRRDASDVTVLTGALLPASMSSEEQWNLRDAVYSIPGVMDTGLRQVIMDRLQELGLPRGDEHEPTPGAFYNLVNRGSGNLIDNYNGRTSPEGGYSFVYFGRTLNMKKNADGNNIHHQWTFRKHGNGYYTIENRKTGCYLASNDKQTDGYGYKVGCLGQNMRRAWDCHDRENTRFNCKSIYWSVLYRRDYYLLVNRKTRNTLDNYYGKTGWWELNTQKYLPGNGGHGWKLVKRS